MDGWWPQMIRILSLSFWVVVASICFAQDRTSTLIEIDCTLQSNLDILKKLRFHEYSYTKVAVVWIAE